MKRIPSVAMQVFKSYRWNSIFIKYLKSFMLLIAVPFLVVGIFFYTYYSNNVETQLRNSAEKNMTRAENHVEGVFEDTEKFFYQLINNNLMSFLLEDDMVYRGMETEKIVAYIQNQMSDFINVTEYINSVEIYSSRNEFILSTEQSGHISDHIKRDVYLPYIENKESYTIQSNSNPDQLCQVLSIPYKDDSLGCVAFFIDIRKLEKLLMIEDLKNEELYIVNKNNYVTYSTGGSFDEKPADKNLTHAVEKMDITIENNGYLYRAHKVSGDTVMIYRSKLMQSENVSLKVSIIMCLIIFVLVLPFLLALYISLRSYSSIALITSQLQTSMNEDENNEFNELTYITKTLMELVESNAMIEKELAEKITKIRSLQSSALQMQINPHFLYNTLNLVSLMLMMENKGGSDAGNVISLLSELLDYSMYSNEFVVDVTEEIFYVRKYVDICKIKYEDSFEVQWNIDNEVNKYKTIKFILQPIMENCFEHGVRLLDDGCTGNIYVSATVENEDLIFVISDDCGGMSEETLKEIWSKLENEDFTQKRHIGIVNVHQRIRMMYGSDYGCRVSSENGCTEVCIRLPAIRPNSK